MLGLAGGNTKKRGNKKSGESITPIHYNVMNVYCLIMYTITYVARETRSHHQEGAEGAGLRVSLETAEEEAELRVPLETVEEGAGH